jgi:Holliday junction resolvasome RuvABC endonuclease subunit
LKFYEITVPCVRAFARKFILAVVGLFIVGLAPQSLHAQSFDRIERERALSMLSTIKDQLKKNYYDPSIRGMDVDTRFKAAEEKIKQANSLGQAFGIIAQALLDFLQPAFAFRERGVRMADAGHRRSMLRRGRQAGQRRRG